MLGLAASTAGGSQTCRRPDTSRQRLLASSREQACVLNSGRLRSAAVSHSRAPRPQVRGFRCCASSENGNGAPASGNGASPNGATGGKESTVYDSVHSHPLTRRSQDDEVHWIASGFGTIDGGFSDRNIARKHPQKNFASAKKHSIRVRNEVQLSAYPNHIGENIKDLDYFMTTHLKGAIGGLHLLPAYPSSGDGGFAPITYQEIEPKFGTWADVESLAQRFDLCLEFMVNHISPQSAQFQDFIAKGDASEYAEMFVDWDKLWPEGRPTKDDLDAIRTRKPEKPMIEVQLADGSTRRLWCTFGPQQIDINPFSEQGKKFVKDSLEKLCDSGAKIVRLDAFGYVTKEPGTRCFFQEPEVWRLLDMVEKIVHDKDTGLLCEVHEEYRTNIRLANQGYWVYDFALPLLVLHAFEFQSATNLKHWLSVCPRRQITVLDTHDGMGIDDITGLANVCDVEELKDTVTTRLGCDPNFKYFYDSDEDIYNAAPHQYNCTYYSALEGNPRHYLMARAIQFWTPGIPMVYYVGLLAGRNDHKAVEEQGAGRAINRHRFTLEEAEANLERPVVRALLQLMRFRNTHPAFNGQISLNDTADEHILEVAWTCGAQRAELLCDLKAMSFQVFATNADDDDNDMHVMRYSLNGFDTSVPESEADIEVDEAQDDDALCRPVEI